MWNILIVIVIAIIIWAFNPLLQIKPKHDAEVQQKTRNEVNQVESQAIQQVNQARQLQKQEQDNINTP